MRCHSWLGVDKKPPRCPIGGDRCCAGCRSLTSGNRRHHCALLAVTGGWLTGGGDGMVDVDGGALYRSYTH